MLIESVAPEAFRVLLYRPNAQNLRDVAEKSNYPYQESTNGGESLIRSPEVSAERCQSP
jgi:hypothetical protein